MTEPLLRNVDETAQILHISPDSLKRAASGGLVPYTRPFGLQVVLFSEKDIADIIAAGRINPVKSPSLATPLRPRRSRKAA